MSSFTIVPGGIIVDTTTNKAIIPAISNQIVLGTTNTLTLTSPAPVSSQTLTLPDPGGSDSVAYLALAQTLTNKTLTTPIINGAASASGNFDLSGSSGTFKTTTGVSTFGGSTNNFTNSISANATTNQLILGTTKTITITSPAPASSETITISDPGGADTFTLNALAQTLTNKTLTTPIINGASSASGNFDLSGSSGTFKTTTGVSTFGGSSNNFTNAISAPSATLSASTNQLVLGTTRTLTITSPEPATSSRTLTLPDPGGSDSVAYLALAQTLGSKTLTSPIISTGLTASGSSANDFSGSSGAFKTSTGAYTNGGSTPTFTNAVTVSATTNQLVLGASAHQVIISSTAPSAASQTLTIPDTGGNATFAFGTGSSNQMAYWGGTNALTSSSNFSISGTKFTASGHLGFDGYVLDASGGATTNQVLAYNGTSFVPTTPSSGAVSSVSNSDGTLTISPTTGAVVASLALGHANTWTGAQTFNTAAVIFGAGATATGSSNFDLSGSSGAEKTTTGAFTVGASSSTFTNGVTFSGSIAVNDGLTASGSASNDFSGSTGTFKTSTGAVTLGSGQVTVTGTGTGLVVNHHASIDGYTIDCSGGAITNQVLEYNGTSFVPTTVTKGIAVAGTTGTIANTETQVVGATITANTLTTSSTFRVSGYGLWTNTTAASSPVFRIRFGTTSLSGNIPASITAAAGTTARTNIPFSIEGLVKVITTGSAGTVQAGMTLTMLNVVAPIVSTGITGTVALDTTANKILELTFISGASTSTAAFFVSVIEQIM